MTSEKQFKRPRMHISRRFLARRVLCCWPWLLFLGAALAAILLLPGGFGRARLRANAEYNYSYISAETAGEITNLEVALGDYVEAGQLIGRLQIDGPGSSSAAQCELRAGVSGVVAGILHQVGDSVRVGDAVVRIGQPSTRRVTAFVPPDHPLNLCVGKRCCVVAQDSNKTYQGKVIFIPSDSNAGNGGSDDRAPREQRITIELVDGELFPGEAVAVVADLSVLNQWFGL
ncbi:MAG: HlyD family efflux transporter periplasmic adaptor subunit [Pontiellaceae bacterium]|nr:HlyD family efflux transporter periplasmic adaptor subunit [Pontiellaceae bacterium]